VGKIFRPDQLRTLGAYRDGRDAFVQGRPLECPYRNPFTGQPGARKYVEAWVLGWQEARAEARRLDAAKKAAGAGLARDRDRDQVRRALGIGLGGFK
jgi:hypothetical protein